MNVKINDGITPELKRLAHRVAALPKQITVTRPVYARIASLGDPRQQPMALAKLGFKCIPPAGASNQKPIQQLDHVSVSSSIKSITEHIRRQIAP